MEDQLNNTPQVEGITQQSNTAQQESTLSSANEHKPFFSRKTSIAIFIVILILVIGTGGIYLLNKQAHPKTSPANSVKKVAISSPTTQPMVTLRPLADTTNWQTFTDPNYSYSYKYPPDWQAQHTPAKGGSNLLTHCDPNDITGYSSDFKIPNTISPNDSALYVNLNLCLNDKNLTLNQWINTHHIAYSSYQNENKEIAVTVNGQQAIKETLLPDAKIWGGKDAPFDQTIYFLKNNLVYVVTFGGNGEGSSKLYTNIDPFVQKELPEFNSFVNSITFSTQQKTTTMANCDSTNLSAIYFGQGATGSIVGGIHLKNTSSVPCVISQYPQIRMGQQGQSSPVLVNTPPPLPLAQEVIINPNEEKVLGLQWGNWCKTQQDNLSVTILLSTSVSEIPAQIDKTNGFSYPRCDNSSSPSTLEITDFQ